MALQKQSVSIDLVKGSDTKTNDQISNNFKEMENIVFTGNLTTKKMNGYDVLYQLPSTEKFSLITRRQNDLLAFSENGTYKFNSNNSTFSKISEIGSSYMQSDDCQGQILGFSTNYRCLIENKYYGLSHRQKISFYSHDGILLNTIYSDLNITSDYANQTMKVLSIGDIFYICAAENNFGVGTVLIYASPYVLNTSTNKFEFVATNSAYPTTLGSITGLDFFTDGTNIFYCYSNLTVSKIVKWIPATPAIACTSASLSIASGSTVEMFNRDASSIYISVITSDSLFNLLIVNKTTLATTATNLIKDFGGGGVAGSATAMMVSYPLSDTTAISLFFSDYNSGIVGSGNNAMILRPISKIFKQGSNYYIGCYFYNYVQIANCIMKILPDVIDNTLYKTYLVGISDSANVLYQAYPFISFGPMVLNSEYIYNNENYMTSLSQTEGNVLIKFNHNAKQTNSYLEIERTNIISNSLPCYFDGETFCEYGFIGVPQITEFLTGVGQSLPADTGYQFMAIYEWQDSFGNIFQSQYSYIESGGNPTTGITLPASSYVTLIIQCGILTYKQNVILKVYIKRANKVFQLAATKKIDSSLLGTAYPITIKVYPPADSELAPFQDNSIQPEMIINSQFVSLFADRVMFLSKDNPISLSYSQQKIDYSPFEFNTNVFFLNILDKRGILEDELTGMIGMDGRLIIFKQNSILYINGIGPARDNSNDDFSAPQLITTDAGCTEPRSIVLTPNGVMFKSDKGIYLLSRSLQIDYIGANVESFNSSTITSAILLEGVNEIRFTTLEGEILVYNYFSSAWSWFKNLPSLSACIWKGKYILLGTDNKVYVETTSHKKIVDGLNHTEIIQKISSPWIRMNGEQWWQKVYDVLMLGKYKTPHQVKMSIYYDYELYASDVYILDPLVTEQYNILERPTNLELENNSVSDGVYQLTIDIVKKSCQAFRIVIEDIPLDIENNTGESFELSNITATIGIKKGPARLPGNKSY